MTKNQKAFLDMIAWSEGTWNIGKNDGYDVIVTSTVDKPVLFSDFSKHPQREMEVLHHGALAEKSDAAGRFQLMGRYYEAYRNLCHTYPDCERPEGLIHKPGFWPECQRCYALQQIKECRALPDIEAGNINLAINKCAHIWASFPGIGYKGQEQRDMGHLLAAFGAALHDAEGGATD
jgi:muramidase (phage lysozyme)